MKRRFFEGLAAGACTVLAPATVEWSAIDAAARGSDSPYFAKKGA
jgi:hypothetical protein